MNNKQTPIFVLEYNTNTYLVYLVLYLPFCFLSYFGLCSRVVTVEAHHATHCLMAQKGH